MKMRYRSIALLSVFFLTPGLIVAQSPPLTVAVNDSANSSAAQRKGGKKTGGVRIKDLARVNGVRENQLIGYGLVVGLPGSGDSRSPIGEQSMATMLNQLGIKMEKRGLNAKNVAAVIVTCDLPPFAAKGDRLPVLVSSVGDAKSLNGGVLLQTPLLAGNGQVYAVAQGTLATGGGERSSGGGRSGATVANISDGALVERGVESAFVSEQRSVAFILNHFDFSTLDRIRQRISQERPDLKPVVKDGSIVIVIPDEVDPVSAVAAVEEMRVVPDYRSRVVINERTGTIVMGGDIRIDPVAVSRGKPDGNKGGDWARMGIYVKNSSSSKKGESESDILRSFQGSSVKEIVDSMNSLGSSISDIIAILEALRDAGVLHAEIELQ